ncbi:CRAL/TRIO domain-containing protein [Cryptosporidium muris RN66]|uniref:CRAL/TRIO domain-containing protein n=1 Tax=Cryptosporidium muris (strain RN66) TaxID=441375 RepID=B6AHG6_CRYMR|nr:CRAL/TRIO domain-containing protein [Cryptosporidium muris RN66]EEA07661.1 CRAL/TRIO domain-containing protein [Cryptosporidium muris RN66]|eukprot:XP_002142010.1 CRAL/TRIO domain-containing protein [Cryptosporidium muris RN66]
MAYSPIMSPTRGVPNSHGHHMKEDKLSKYRNGAERDLDITKYRPEEAVYYNPPIEAIKYGQGETGMRYVFGDLELDNYEEQKVTEMLAYLKNRHVSLRNTAFNDKHLLLRYLQGNEYDFVKAWDDIKRHVRWRQHFRTIEDCHKLQKLLETGYCYIHGRDRFMRPIIIFRAKAFLDGQEPDDILHMVYHWFEFIIMKMLVWNKIEQWRVIMDLEDVSFYNAPISLLKDIAINLQRNYRGYLAQMTFINSPIVFWGLWQAISLVLPQSTREKISLFTSEYKNDLLKYIHPNQLEKKYGGDAPNVTLFSEPVLPPAPFN